MGYKIIENGNYLEINKKNFDFNNLLLNFIYKDYSEFLNYVNNSAQVFEKILDTDLNNKTTYNTIRNFFENIYKNNPYIKEDKYKDDPFFFLFLYEFYILDDKINFSYSLETIIYEIKKIISGLVNLQDLYFEAINLCFNESHAVLSKYSIEERIDYYSNLPYGINVIKNSPYKSSFSSGFICIENESKLNEFLFDSEENFICDDIQLLSTSTYVESRKNFATYDEKEKTISYSHEPTYYVPNNQILMNLNNKVYTTKTLIHVLEFNNVFSLCSFLFFKMIENYKSFSIKECQLCRKLFSKSTKSLKIYCDNIFSTTNKKCSDKNIGPKIILKIKNRNNNLESFYFKIYKRICRRPYRLDREALDVLKLARKSYNNKIISSEEYDNILKFFDNLHPNSYTFDLVPNELQETLKKITST